MSSNIYYNCCYDDVSWEASLSIKRCNPDFISCQITGYGFQFDIHLGLSYHNYWLCIPLYEKATSLSCFSDTLYNFDKVSNILEDQPIIVTMITTALSTISSYLS